MRSADARSVAIDDQARFDADEPDAVVRASFICRFCLHVADLVLVDGEVHCAPARCVCTACGTQTVVALDTTQRERLWLRPVVRVHVHFELEQR